MSNRSVGLVLVILAIAAAANSAFLVSELSRMPSVQGLDPELQVATLWPWLPDEARTSCKQPLKTMDRFYEQFRHMCATAVTHVPDVVQWQAWVSAATALVLGTMGLLVLRRAGSAS